MSEFSGRVSGFDAGKGFGFIPDPDGGPDDVFAHVNELVDASQKGLLRDCLLYTSPSPRDRQKSRMPSSA